MSENRRPAKQSKPKRMSEQLALKNIQAGHDLLTSLKVLFVINVNRADYDQAEEWWNRRVEFNLKADVELEMLYLKMLVQTGRYQEALQQVTQLVEQDAKDAEHAEVHFYASHAHYKLHELQEALSAVECAIKLAPDSAQYLFHKATILTDLFRHSEAAPIFEQLIKKEPKNHNFLNNAGNMYRDLSDLKRAQTLFKRAMPLSGQDTYPYSNYLTTLHYDPDVSAEEIFKVCLEWEKRFAPRKKNPRPSPDGIKPDHTIKIGMVSDGFQNHPVGRMIIAGLEKLPRHAFSLFAYSSSGKHDAITKRFKSICTYKHVSHLKDEQLKELILADGIDILIDLAGHNSGTRMKVMAMEPAPILVKWVGGLINTTGVTAIDYLISDNIETPAGSDNFYTEKLIRMPGDYICYEMPAYIPPVSSLPALDKGHITLGCFNNPTKVNDTILAEWASIMHALPNSQLYLKGHYYNAEALRSRVLETLDSLGIKQERVRIEGPSGHEELLACYNEVDIALDPWPYSGGLTTCEAFAMGVPVVTMPGPTFAGRHSATHLVNAGMPELVTHSWEEYRARVLELASDLESLATIRSHLRSVLLQSPVCDAETFAGHLNNALRAIWQRYTEGKAPAALSFNEQGELLFEGENSPVELQHPEAPPEQKSDSFHWQFDGRVIAIDQGAQLLDTPVVQQMLNAGTLELIAFDPASRQLKHPMRQAKGIHYYPNILLGKGTPATLYACQSPDLSGTLKPLDAPSLPKALVPGLSVLAELPVNTLALDQVNELPSVDWLLLDDLNNSLDVLEQGNEALKDTLLLHADLAFQPTHEHQPNFTEISHWAARHGFRFYCFNGEENRTPVPQNIIGANRYANELVSATALFIPSQERLAALSDNQRTKLAFIADTAYGLEGLSYEVLGHTSAEAAEQYIQYKVRKRVAEKQPHVPTSGVRRKPRIIIDNSSSQSDAGAEISKPEVTLPADVAEHLAQIYAQSDVILEYGSGGSTVLASEMPNKRIFTVENDVKWAEKMRRYIEQEPHASPAVIHTVDIGATGPWARPVDDTNWRVFHTYPLSVWDREDFIEPDVVLIDGRFRVACFVATLMRIKKPTTVLFDDYGDRDYYHQIERLAKPKKLIGRMAHFELVPGEIPRDELTWMLASFNQVTYANNTRR